MKFVLFKINFLSAFYTLCYKNKVDIIFGLMVVNITGKISFSISF